MTFWLLSGKKWKRNSGKWKSHAKIGCCLIDPTAISQCKIYSYYSTLLFSTRLLCFWQSCPASGKWCTVKLNIGLAKTVTRHTAVFNFICFLDMETLKGGKSRRRKRVCRLYYGEIIFCISIIGRVDILGKWEWNAKPKNWDRAQEIGAFWL